MHRGRVFSFLMGEVCLHLAIFPNDRVRNWQFMKQFMQSRYQTKLRLCLAAAVVVAASASWCAHAAEANATNVVTLNEAVRLALAHNPRLRASDARVAAAAGRANQAKVWSNPELELNADEWPVTGGGRGFRDAIQTIGISQTLPYPGKKKLDREIGGAGVKVSEAELALRQTEIVRDVKAGFSSVLAAERQVEVSQELVSVAKASADATRKRVDAGGATYQEQLRAEVQLEQARTELAGLERERAAARQALVTVIGRPELREAKFSGQLAETPEAPLLLLGSEASLANHPSAAVAQGNLARAELERRRARLEPYPDVKASVSGGRLGQSDQGIIQLGLSVPLPILDRSKGRQQEAEANVQVAEAEVLVVQQQLQRELHNAHTRYATAVEQVTNYRERILPKANEALRLVQMGFEQGKFGFIDLVDTQRTTAEARLAYQQKLLEMNIARAELEALLHPQNIPGTQEK